MVNRKLDIELMQQIIISYANADFSKRMEISELSDDFDVISAGINMLGEELAHNTFTRNFLHKIIDNIPVCIFVCDLDFNIFLINHFAIGFFDVDLKFKKLNEIIPEILFNQIVKRLSRDANRLPFENQFEFKDKQLFTNSYIRCLDDVKKNHFLLVIKDVSHQKNAKLDALQATFQGQELERRRLAFDLHDSLGQELNAIQMFLNALDNLNPSEALYKSTLSNARLMLKDSIDNLRSISYDLIPSGFTENDLLENLRKMISRMNEIYHVPIQLHFRDKELVFRDKQIQIIVYRILQEFINNSLKHAQCSLINLEIKKNKSKLEFIVNDNGIGFDPTIVKQNGLRNIRMRLDSIRAEYTFKSELNVGTELEFKLANKMVKDGKKN